MERYVLGVTRRGLKGIRKSGLGLLLLFVGLYLVGFGGAGRRSTELLSNQPLFRVPTSKPEVVTGHPEVTDINTGSQVTGSLTMRNVGIGVVVCVVFYGAYKKCTSDNTILRSTASWLAEKGTKEDFEKAFLKFGAAPILGAGISWNEPTLLHRVFKFKSVRGKEEIIGSIVDEIEGMDVSVVKGLLLLEDNLGNTPLHNLFHCNAQEEIDGVVKIVGRSLGKEELGQLLEKKNKEGKTPLDLGEKNCSEGVSAYVKE